MIITGDHSNSAQKISNEINDLKLDIIQGSLNTFQERERLATIVLELKHLYADMEQIWRKG